MRRSLIALIVSLILIVAGLSGAYTRLAEHATLTRGWADPSTDANLPFRVPLAGINVELTQYDADQLPTELARIADAGFTWVRQSFLWAEIEPRRGEYDFRRYDAIVAAVSAHPRLKLVAVLESTPEWARKREAIGSFYAPPSNPEDFANFARAFARRYADRIDFYQLWDEPNLRERWGLLDPRPADYAALLAAAYPAIKGNDLEATVILAGLAPTTEAGPRNISDVLYLESLYQLGAADFFDAAAAKPYGFNASPQDRTVNAQTLNFSRVILLREVMLKYGDGKKALWGSHFGWNSLPTGWRGSPSIWGSVDAATQRDWTRAAYLRARSEWPWLGGLILAYWQPSAPADDPIQGFAVSAVAAEWFEQGAFFASDGFEVGLHHPRDARITYQGRWRLGGLGADSIAPEAGEAPLDGSAYRLTFRFTGKSVGFQVRRGDYLAYLYVIVDGQPANALPQQGDSGYIVLRSETSTPSLEIIQAANGLTDGQHEAEARLYLGYDRWALAAIGVGNPPPPLDTFPIIGALLTALVGVIGVVLAIRSMPQAPKQAAAHTISAYLRRMSGMFGSILLSIAAALSFVLTVNESLPPLLRRDGLAVLLTSSAVGVLYFSPNLIITLIALSALFMLIYNRPLIGLALIVFWIPFFLAPIDLHVWAAPMVEVLTLLSFGAAFLRGAINRLRGKFSAAPLRLSTADWAMLALVLLGIASLLWSSRFSEAIRELRILLIEPALFYMLLRTAKLNRGDYQILVDVFLLAGAVVSALGLYGFFSGVGGVAFAEQGTRRLMSVYTSPNNLALFLGRCIPFGMAMFLCASGTVRKISAAAVTLLMLAAYALTQSAGAAILGFPMALATVLLLWHPRRGGLILAGLVVLGLIALPILSQIPRLQGILNLQRTSSLVRTQLWTASVSLIREHPITGVGLDQFLYAYRSRYILPEAWAEPDLSHPHNVLLDFWVRLGIAGVAAFAVLQSAFWRAGIKAWRRFWRVPPRDPLLAAVLIGACGAMANVLAHGLVDNSYFVTDLAYAFCFIIGISQNLRNWPNAPERVV